MRNHTLRKGAIAAIGAILAAGAAASGSITANAASSTPITPEAYVFVFAMPTSATSNYDTWFDQALIGYTRYKAGDDINKLVPSKRGKYQLDVVEFTTSEAKTKFMDGVLRDGILTKDEDKATLNSNALPGLKLVKSKQVWLSL